MKNVLVLSMVIFLVISCGNNAENKVNENILEEVVKNPNTFKVEVEGIWTEDDELIIFWKDASISYFDEDHTIYQGIKGSDMPQKIIFELEEGFVPNDIRFDISSNKEQKRINLNYIKFEQHNRYFVVTKDKLENFFKPNEFIVLDKNSGIITTTIIDGTYDPILFTTPSIYAEIEKVLNTKL